MANTPKFIDFLQLPKKFWMSKYLLLMTEVPDLLQAGIPRDGLQCTLMHWTFGGYILRGVCGSSPRKCLNSRWRIPQNLMIFFNYQINFGCPNIFCLWRRCQTSCKRVFPEAVFNAHWCTEHLKYMGTTCGGAVVLNDLEEFEADEKSVSRQISTSQMSWKTRDLKSGSNQLHL